MDFGACYYPEQYPLIERREKILEDISLMREMKMNTVRIMEFAWCEMEPSDGVYSFDWLDEIINLLGENGISSILCTPTAAQPIWMSCQYPETLYVNPDGTKRRYGARRNSCYNSEIYRKKSVQIAEKMAERYGKNPYVLGFQIDNEFAQEDNGRCCCEHCRSLFIDYLKDKYKTIEGLNDSWGTIFWGQKYQSFEQIIPPYMTTSNPWKFDVAMGVDAPSLRLSYEHFCSDSIIGYYNLQYDAVKKHTDKPVTTNSTGTGMSLVEYNKLFKKADVFAVDIYTGLNSVDKNYHSFSCAFSRGMLGKDFWLLETYCGGGHGNWSRCGIEQGAPGTLRNNVLFTYICGSSVITVFKLHAFKSGFEQLGSSLFDLDRKKRRRFYEFKEAGELAERLTPLLNSTVINSDVAVVFDYDSRWSMRIKPISSQFDYESFVCKYYGAMRKCGVNVDVITPDKDIDAYRVVLLPCLTIVSAEYAARLKSFVKKGGTVIGTFLTASKTEECNGSEQSMPINLTDMFGAVVAEQDFIPNGNTSKEMEFCGESFVCDVWNEEMELNSASAYATYKTGFRSGSAAITENSYGDGTAYYTACSFSQNGVYKFFDDVLSKNGITRYPLSTDSRVEIVKRVSADRTYYFVVNNSPENVKLDFSGSGVEVLSGERIEKSIELAPMQIRVIESNN